MGVLCGFIAGATLVLSVYIARVGNLKDELQASLRELEACQASDCAGRDMSEIGMTIFEYRAGTGSCGAFYEKGGRTFGVGVDPALGEAAVSFYREFVRDNFEYCSGSHGGRVQA